jgi:hypothetical protein
MYVTRLTQVVLDVLGHAQKVGRHVSVCRRERKKEINYLFKKVNYKVGPGQKFPWVIKRHVIAYTLNMDKVMMI